VRARWTGEHRGNVLEQLESAVERSAGSHLEGDIGVPVVDAVAAGPPSEVMKSTSSSWHGSSLCVESVIEDGHDHAGGLTSECAPERLTPPA
jgi:hypothetical protein